MKILIIDPYFPTKGSDKRTKASYVVYDYANIWKEKHDVFVIRVIINFPSIINRVLRYLKKPRYEAKTGRFINNGLNGYIVNVKKLPMRDCTKKEYKKKSSEIIEFLITENFKPDICVSHFLIPGYKFLSSMKERFNCKTFLTLHNTDLIHLDKSKSLVNNFRKNICNVDGFGARNKNIASKLKHIFDIDAKIIESGVSLCNISENNNKKGELYSITNIIYYGRFTKNKNIYSVIDEVYKFPNVRFDVYGEGPEKENYLRLIKRKNIHNVIINDYIKHDNICSVLKKYDYFIMPSLKETFGLSYIESMSAGVIPIGTIGQGIDGIIIDRFNGFLINPHKEAIFEVIEKISNIESAEKLLIRKNAIDTSKSFSKTLKAEKYLGYIIESD